MRRREFITLLGAAAAAWSLAAGAQQQRMAVIGVLSPFTHTQSRPQIAEFRRGLFDNGFAEGQNVAIVLVRGRSIRSPAGAGSGIDPSFGRSDLRGGFARSARCESSDHNNTGRFRRWLRSSHGRSRRELDPTRRKRYRHDAHEQPTGPKTIGSIIGPCSKSDRDRDAGQPGQSGYGSGNRGGASRDTTAWSAAPDTRRLHAD